MRGLLAAFVGVAALVSPLSATAAEPEVSPYIVGGREATQDYDFAASLIDPGHKGVPQWHFCGATLVASRWVVTAGHCTELPGHPDAPDIRVRVGSNDRLDGGTVTGVRRIVTSEFSPDPFRNDIALLELDRAVPEVPAYIPADAGSPGDRVRMIGWGLTTPDSSGMPPAQLRELDTSLLPSSDCAGGQITDKELCLNNPHGIEGVCPGDSGSGVHNPKSSREVLALTSRGVDESVCGGAPSIHTDLTAWRGWIYRTILDLPPDAPIGPAEVRKAVNS